MKIGFIGQGWIGRHYADDFKTRGYDVVRYGLEEEYKDNREAIANCDIVFIAVPTPTTPEGFDGHIVRSVMSLVGEGKIAIIKSTIPPGTTESIQLDNPNIFVLHSPEFLVEKTAAYDAAHPERNIIGIPVDNELYREKAKFALSVMPESSYNKIMPAKDAELIKYAGNSFLFTKVVYMNLLYDLVEKIGGDWNTVRDALVHDSRIGVSHTQPVFDSGRGAGGHCFIKDFEVLFRMYEEHVSEDILGIKVIEALKDKNISLLLDTNKDRDLLEGVYGIDLPKK